MVKRIRWTICCKEDFLCLKESKRSSFTVMKDTKRQKLTGQVNITYHVNITHTFYISVPNLLQGSISKSIVGKSKPRKELSM